MNARLRSLSLAVAVPAILFAVTPARADEASRTTAPDSGSFSEIAKSHLSPSIVDAARGARDRVLSADDATAAADAATAASDDANQLAVAVPPVPEPETYALMLAGLGVLGAAAKRRAAAARKARGTR